MLKEGKRAILAQEYREEAVYCRERIQQHNPKRCCALRRRQPGIGSKSGGSIIGLLFFRSTAASRY